jgi:hypothetical protein
LLQNTEKGLAKDMDILTTYDLKLLFEDQSEHCVSLFTPMDKGTPDYQKNPIRFKNLLGEVEEKLTAAGLRDSEIDKLLEPARKLLEVRSFWQHQGDGLAAFLSPELFRVLRLPLSFDKLVVVTGRFHLKPLLPLIFGSERFYLLTLSKKKIELLQGTQFNLDAVDLDQVPQGIQEALKYDDPERQLQFHTGTSDVSGKRSAMFHGHGVGKDDSKDNILRYFRQIDKGLGEILREERIPLVIAGVEYLLPIYKQANTYPHLLQQGIPKNPDDLSLDQLHKEAWNVIEPLFSQERQQDAARFNQLKGTARTSDLPDVVVRAAFGGRVDVLFIPLGVQVWGSFDPKSGAILLHDKERPGDQDLLDLAAIYTLMQGGKVYAVKKDQVPGGVSAAAIFRY